ncbi:MAG: DUF4238 domain-containing protein [Candidatus Nomurabacteria bacterium]|nr:DUF4238 domain-containing protein [Candidatus Nomurabacteria bacterium]
MKEQVTKNQHHIPQSLLRYFADSDERIFEVHLVKQKVYPTTVINSMCETFAYEHEKLKANTIENYLSKIEGEVAKQIKDLIKIIEKIENNKIDISEAKKIIEGTLHYFLLFYYRSGALLTEFSSLKKEDKIPLLSEKILNHDYLNELAGVIKNFYKFALIKSSDNFLISDQFISTSALRIKSQFFDLSNRHIGLNETLILIPISSTYYIAYWNTKNSFILKEDTIIYLDESEIELFNNTIINNSYNKCAGKKRADIEKSLLNFKYASPTQTFAGGNPDGYSMGSINKKEVFFYEEERKAWDLFKSHNFNVYKELGRNEKCKCGSGKKFKYCHLDVYKRVREIWMTFSLSQKEGIQKFCIWGVPIIEQPIDRWSGYTKK